MIASSRCRDIITVKTTGMIVTRIDGLNSTAALWLVMR